MNFVTKILNKFFAKKLEIKPKLWKTDKCYRCGQEYNKNNFWAEFTEISGEEFAIPVCDKCIGDLKYEKPINLNLDDKSK